MGFFFLINLRLCAVQIVTTNMELCLHFKLDGRFSTKSLGILLQAGDISVPSMISIFDGEVQLRCK